MPGTETDEIPALTSQRDVTPHKVGDIGRLADLLLVVISQTWTVTAAPTRELVASNATSRLAAASVER